MHTGKLDMLTDSIRDDLTILRHSIHFYLFGMFNKLAYHYRMFFRNISCQFKETLQLFLVGTDVHGCTTKHIGRANKHRKTDLINKLINIVHRGELAPARLIYTNTIEHGRELLAVFGIIYALGRST